MKKFLALVLGAMLALSIVGTASASSYYMSYTTDFAEEVGWYWLNDTSLFLDAEAGTYTLMYKSSAFGTVDPGDKGSKTIIYTGTCTVAPSADGETAHQDVTITSVDTVMLEQHGKFIGRNVLNYAMVLDSANWTEEMEEMYGDTCEAWVANHQAPMGLVLTVEDLALDYDDVTLYNHIVSGLDGVVLEITE